MAETEMPSRGQIFDRLGDGEITGTESAIMGRCPIHSSKVSARRSGK